MPFIKHVALKFAPCSTANLPAVTSPSTLAVGFNDNVPETRSVPENLPSKSASEQSKVPIITPDLPTTTLPVVLKVPSIVPSTLKPPSEIISPTILVPSEILF